MLKSAAGRLHYRQFSTEKIVAAAPITSRLFSLAVPPGMMALALTPTVYNQARVSLTSRLERYYPVITTTVSRKGRPKTFQIEARRHMPTIIATVMRNTTLRSAVSRHQCQTDFKIRGTVSKSCERLSDSASYSFRSFDSFFLMNYSSTGIDIPQQRYVV